MTMMEKKVHDFSSGLMNVNIGHGNQRCNSSCGGPNATSKLCHQAVSQKYSGDLGKKLAEISPGNLTKTVHCFGATAIENAIKPFMQATLHYIQNDPRAMTAGISKLTVYNKFKCCANEGSSK